MIRIKGMIATLDTAKVIKKADVTTNTSGHKITRIASAATPMEFDWTYTATLYIEGLHPSRGLIGLAMELDQWFKANGADNESYEISSAIEFNDEIGYVEVDLLIYEQLTLTLITGADTTPFDERVRLGALEYKATERPARKGV